MDADRFDDVLRQWGQSRRPLLGAGLGALLGLADLTVGEARKKKKKKCKAPKVKCGKKCLPANSCCTDANCGGNGVCQTSTCACFAGFRSCNGSCIPEGNCCSSADCGGGVCASGQCRCLASTKVCGAGCIPEAACCTNEDCGSPCKTCQNGTCSAGCAASETCLPNGSCGLTCPGSSPPPTGCSCNNNTPGFESVLRVTNNGTICGPAQTCTTTAECPVETVCSSSCLGSTGDNRCLPLCNA